MSRFARLPVFLALAAVLALGACGSDKPKASSSSSPSKSSSSSSSSTKSSSSSTDASDSDSDSGSGSDIESDVVSDARDQPVVALAADGLTVVTVAGITKPLDFGTDEPTVKTALESALDKPKSSEIAQPCEDGSGRAFDSVRYDGLAVFFLDGKLSGWGSSANAFTTLDGIGVGSTLADLKESFGDVTVMDSSLGVEFSAGTIGGVLDGKADSAKVTDIFNGQVCIIR
jgi:hypothetical protein